MKKLIILLLAFTVVSNAARAQLGNNASENEMNMRQLMQITPWSPGARGFDNRYEGVHGTPYLFETWLPATVQLKGSDPMPDEFKVNINQEQNLLVLQLKDGTVGNISASRIRELRVRTDAGLRVFQSIPPSAVEGPLSDAGSKEQFFEVLHEGKITLLKGFRKTFQKADYQGAYSSNRPYDEYLTQERYYFRTPGKGFQELSKLKPKGVEKALSGYEVEIGKAVKSKGLDLYAEQDVITLVKSLDH